MSIFHYTHALVRPVPNTFANALCMEKPEQAIDLTLARTQHDAYVELIQSLVSSVIEVPASDAYPDCCFIEDTMEFFSTNHGGPKGIAVVNNLGAPSRQGEEAAVRSNLKLLAETHLSVEIVELQNGNVDGGDVLFIGDAVLVGKSDRTNAEGIESLAAALKPLDLPVFTIPVTAGLHLKSCCSIIDDGVIVVADNEAGRAVRLEMEKLPSRLDFVMVPDGVASNVLRIGNDVIIQDGYPQSEDILRAYADSQGLTIHKLQMSEFIKADGALTCCNVLLRV